MVKRSSISHFDGLGVKKLPSINQLKQEWAALAAEKKKLYSGYQELKDNSRQLALAKANADRILGITQNSSERDASRNQQRGNPQEI
ncbi:MAG: hypothetical protein LBQ71_04385 [Hungatella sp.]|jgi:hypothetical protein|nr:hypothetical protein [Hungatella sp.]